MSRIFHEALGRCADHKTVTDATEKEYLMQYIIHRWAEMMLQKSKGDMVKNY